MTKQKKQQRPACIATVLGLLIVGCGYIDQWPERGTAKEIPPHAEILTPLAPIIDTPSAAGIYSAGIVSPSGFYGPLGSFPNYDCTYASSGGATYTTLWADNEDGGYRAARATGHTGSDCDHYDDLSGRSYQGQFCGAHPGVDIAVVVGTPIYAIYSGTVEAIDSAGSGSFGWGKYIVLNIPVVGGNIHVTYAHLSSVERGLATGVFVTAGQQLGATGNSGHSTGAHLHFQIDRDTVATHPYWPASGGANTPDRSRTTEIYTYNPLYAIGFGSCY